MWLSLAYVTCVAGFGWLALAMETHWQQVRATVAPPDGPARVLRVLGALALAVGLGVCLHADRASMAALVWVMLLAAAALTVAFTLSWCPRLLAPLVVWVRDGAAGGAVLTWPSP